MDAGPIYGPPRPPPLQPSEPGTLRIVATPNCNIWVDGKPTGLRTPQVAIKLSAGRHKVTLANDEHGLKYTFPVTIKANQIDTEIKDLRDDANASGEPK